MIKNKDKWKILSCLLLLIYLIMGIVFSLLRIKYMNFDDPKMTNFAKIKSSFLILSPNLLLFFYLVWRTYNNNKNK